MVNKRNEKSSLDAATVALQAVAANGYIEFGANTETSGCSIVHTAGSNTVQLISPGLYLINFNADLTADAAGDITIQMFNNGIPLAGAGSTITAVVDTDYQIGFSALVRILPSCCYVNNNGNIQVQLSAAGTVTNAHITVVKQA